MYHSTFSIYNLCLSVTVLLTGIATASAQSFKSENLKVAANRLGLFLNADSLLREHTMLIEKGDGQEICLRTDSQGVIDHIGIPLFKEDIRVLMPSLIYDFLEYAVLDWKYSLNPNPLLREKIMFRTGSWKTVANGEVLDCRCDISNICDSLYIVSWKREEQTVAELGIPVDYELFNGSKRMAERDLLNLLLTYQQKPKAEVKTVCEDELKIYGTEGLFVKQGEWKYLPELNQNTYYQWETITETADTVIHGQEGAMTFETVVPVLVISEEHPAETFANLMLCAQSYVPDTQLQTVFHLSDYRRQEVQLSTSTLNSFFQQQGVQLFFAPGIIVDGRARAILFAVDKQRGCNHLFSLKADIKELTADIPHITADAFLFIRPIETEKLFKEAPTRKSKSGFQF